MFRLPVLVVLICAACGASTLSWRWDVFQPTARYFTNALDIADWLPPLSSEEKAIDLDGEYPVEEVTVPGSLTAFDLS
jgi:hypothetical protein